MEHRLPHRAPALLAREIVNAGADEVLVRCRVPADSPFLRTHPDGRRTAPALLLLEMAAQAAAALRADAAPAASYVVSFEDARLAADELDAETVVLARVRAGRVAPPLRYYSYDLAREADGVELLTGTLAVYG